MGGSLLLWLAAAVWVDWRSCAAAGVCITATVMGKLWYRRKEQHLQPRLRGRSTRKSRRASWPGAGVERCRSVEGVGRVEGVGSVEGSDTVDTVDTPCQTTHNANAHLDAVLSAALAPGICI